MPAALKGTAGPSSTGHGPPTGHAHQLVATRSAGHATNAEKKRARRHKLPSSTRTASRAGRQAGDADLAAVVARAARLAAAKAEGRARVVGAKLARSAATESSARSRERAACGEQRREVGWADGDVIPRLQAADQPGGSAGGESSYADTASEAERRAGERRRHDHDRPARPSLRAGGGWRAAALRASERQTLCTWSWALDPSHCRSARLSA